jgi:hypothetical protein
LAFILNLGLIRFIPWLWDLIKTTHGRRRLLSLLKKLENIFEHIYDPGFDLDSLKPLLTNDFFAIEIQKLELAILSDRYTKNFIRKEFDSARKTEKLPLACMPCAGEEGKSHLSYNSINVSQIYFHKEGKSIQKFAQKALSDDLQLKEYLFCS